MKKTVVSFADEAGSYRRAMNRLEDSLIATGFDGEFKGYTSFEEIGSPPHKGPGSVPYAFKAYAIKKAIEEGAELLLWADSPIYATQSIQPVFDHIEREGYLFLDNVGFNLGQWLSDDCLNLWQLDREDSFNTQIVMACLMGFNLKNPLTLRFLNWYINAASDGISYHGDWFNNLGQVSSDSRVLGSRHDQTVASIVIKGLDLKITNAQQTFFAYQEHKSVMSIADSVCLWSSGIE